MRDRYDGDRRAGPEAGRGETGSDAAPAGKPLERVADARAIHRACADAADDSAGIQRGQRARGRIDHPRDADQNAAADHHPFRSEAIDQIAFHRNQPGLDQNEQSERHLNVFDPPVVLGIDGVDEQCPAVLQIGDAGHADDADDELDPRIAQRRDVDLRFSRGVIGSRVHIVFLFAREIDRVRRFSTRSSPTKRNGNGDVAPTFDVQPQQRNLRTVASPFAPLGAHHQGMSAASH